MKVTYRADIDGLRALSILLVVAFHAGVPHVNGGFVGVDVFFVISGYLITQLLLHDWKEHGKISLLTFYTRRARRILPAFCVVAIATLALSMFLLTPIGEQQSLAKWTVASALFVSNIFFALRTPGYFDAGVELNPMLHTWSLAVEEQFYLVWPLLLMAALKLAKHRRVAPASVITVVIVSLTLMSLAYSVVITGIDSAAAFYLTHSRTWELGLGALLAVQASNVTRLVSGREKPIAIIGIACILSAAAMYSSDTRFPGPAALLPVLGTVLTLAAGISESSQGRLALLTFRPAVLLGKFSYSWYLWHWPLLAMTRAAFPASQMRDAMLMLVALGLAAITYFLVEEPVRREQRLQASRRTTLAVSLVVSLGICAIAASLWGWARQRLATDQRYQVLNNAALDIAGEDPACEQSGKFIALPPISNCILGFRSASHWVVVWGDSHARHLIPAFSAAVDGSEVGILQRTRSSCLPLYPAAGEAVWERDSSCEAFNRAVLNELALLSIERRISVVLSGKWLAATWHKQPLSGAGKPSSGIFFGPHNGTTSEFESRLRDMLQRLRALNINVVVVAPFVELPRTVPTCLVRNSSNDCGQRSSAELRMNQITRETLRRTIMDYRQTRFWAAIDLLCGSAECLTQRDGAILFRDRSHLTTTGALLLRDQARAQLEWLIAENSSDVAN